MVQRLFSIFLILLALPTAAQAAVSDFPRPASLEPQIHFWKAIFTEYSEHQAVIHDELLPDKIHRVLDFRGLHNSGVSEGTYWRKRKAAERKAKNEIRAMLRRIQSVNGDRSQLNAEERRLRDRYAAYTSRTKYSNAASRVRSQGGLKERFRKAIIISGRYMPYMESVFRQYGLPVELTRLPFVESSFNIHAYSSVAAAGIWQFMPATAKIYRLRRNDVIDERRDPWLSTHAAAKHLRDDYKMLKDWGLAVTAYNFGRAGVARAVRSVNGDGIEDVIKQYEGRRFGFASKNFYTSFVAAMEVVEESERHFGHLKLDAPIQFDEVKAKHYVEFSTMAKLAGLSVAALEDLNPAFTSPVRTGKLRVPPDYAVRVPQGSADAFYQRYAALGPGHRFTGQKSYYARYKVRSGDNLSSIARRHGSSVRSIMRANGLSSAHRIRIGQVLKIPSATARGSSQPVAYAASTPGTGAAYRVRGGDTLGAIARRYGTSVTALMRANNLSNAQKLKIGQRLSIPGARNVAVRSASSTHRVRSGEVLGAIARRYGVSVSSIMRANGLKSAHKLRVGQRLSIPSSGSTRAGGYVSHTVSHGQTLSTIARRYRSTVRAIQSANQLKNAHSIRVGQILRIPSS